MATASSSNGPAVDEQRGGFALALVVLLLFAVGIAGAVGYQVVQAEARLALQAQEGVRALAAASGGLQRYLGSQQGEPADSVTYSVGAAEAVVTRRRVFQLGDTAELYSLRSEGRFTDPRMAEVPATRAVRTFAVLRLAPLGVLGAFNTSASPVAHGSFQIDGRDQAGAGGCAWAGTDEAALVAPGPVYSSDPAMLQGSAQWRELGSEEAFLDSMNVAWSALSDPAYEVDFDGTWPDFDDIHPDTMPTIRVWGDLEADANAKGWGVLIVTGALDFQSGFEWDGVILAGENDPDITGESFEVRGMYIGGLSGSDGSVSLDAGGTFYFHSCNVLAASAKLAYLDPVSGTWWEDAN